MTILSSNILWVICNQPMYADFSADMDCIYTSESEAKDEAQRLSKRYKMEYWVENLTRAIASIKHSSFNKGESSFQCTD